MKSSLDSHSLTHYKQYAKRAINLIDLTSLTNEETEEDIIKLCQQAKSIAGNTAAVCIYPRYIPLAKQTLSQQNTPEIKIATVVNFPDGNNNIANAVEETKAAIALGADEIDVVFPYSTLIEGDKNNKDCGYELISACKEVCGNNILLKVIIETGVLKSPHLIKQASEIAIDAGAGFIKTSTGKVAINATLEAAQIMLTVIKSKNPNVGFKAAGGVKNINDVIAYLQLAEEIMGIDWCTAQHFRFGASSLLNNLLIPELN